MLAIQIASKIQKKSNYKSLTTKKSSIIKYSYSTASASQNANSAIIIGASVAGLTAAHMLRKAGINVKIFERGSTGTTNKGIGFSLQSGKIILNQLGFKEKFEKISTPIHYISQQTFTGETLADLDVLGTMKDMGKPVEIVPSGVLRSELLKMLTEGLENQLSFGKNFVKYEQNEGGVTAYFEDGSKETADVLVGADGLNSKIRRQMFGDAFESSQAGFSGLNIWWGLTSPPLPNGQTNLMKQIFSDDARYFGYYQMGQKIAFWSIAKADKPALESWEVEGGKSEMKKYLTGAPKEALELVERGEKFLHMGLYFHNQKLPSWHQGRVVILGDAAHSFLPYLGQGANNAIEDALQLIVSMQNNESLDQAFTEYYKIRCPKTDSLRSSSLTMAKLEMTDSKVTSWIRNTIFKVGNKLGVFSKMLGNIWSMPVVNIKSKENK